MPFQNQKKTFLAKQDKSSIGSIDSPIKELVELINSKPNYYTTSSCSGRIILLQQAEDGSKHKAKKIFVSHEPVKFEEIMNNLKEISNLKDLPKEEIWFRQEGLILHVCCKTIDDARKLIDIVKSKGINLKRSGISSISKASSKIIVEILSTDKVDCPISKKSRLIVDENYIRLLIETANKKLERNRKKINEIKKLISFL